MTEVVKISDHDIPTIDLGRKGMRLFKLVSTRTPASETAQSALLAALCQRQSLSPGKLGRSLLANPSFVEDIIDAAKIRHTTNERAPKQLLYNDVVKNLKNVFRRAQDMLILDHEQLKDIYSRMYAEHQRKPSGDFSEHSFDESVQAMVSERKKALLRHGRD